MIPGEAAFMKMFATRDLIGVLSRVSRSVSDAICSAPWYLMSAMACGALLTLPMRGGRRWKNRSENCGNVVQSWP